jgi:hypothetical protein
MSSLIVHCNQYGRQDSPFEDEHGCMTIGQLVRFLLIYQPLLLLFAVLTYLFVFCCMITDCIARKRQLNALREAEEAFMQELD